MSAITSYNVRAIYKAHTSSQTTWAGTYKLVTEAKSMPSPFGSPNLVETTSFEDSSQTYTKGIDQVESQEITGNYDYDKLKEINAISGQCDVITLYGSDGVGGKGKFAKVCQLSANISNVGGIDEVVEMSVTVIPNTVAEDITETYTVTENNDGTFTVAVVSE